MQRTTYIANRVREVLLNGRWIANTNFKSAIENVRWYEATYRIENLNTVAALIYHVNYYLGGLINVFEGGGLEIRDRYSFDLPPIHSDTQWKDLVNIFLSNAEKFANHVENMPDEKLNEIFVDEKYGTYLRNIEGIIEHSYYHLGQISLLVKMIKERERDISA